jgi:TPR repeat protein
MKFPMNLIVINTLRLAALCLLCHAQTQAGTTPEEIKEFRDAKILAEKGNPEAQGKVGHFYRTGTGVARDSVEAVRWLRKSADQGYAQAQCNLGICYQYGDGVDEDKARAIVYFRMAAEQGAFCGLSNLAFCYKQGDGVAKNLVEAYALYLMAGSDKWAKEIEGSMSLDQVSAGKNRFKELQKEIETKKAAQKAIK